MYPPIKRFFDILVSLAVILVLLPFLLPVAIALRLTGEGYVFYRQKRRGYRGREFGILKFATMLKNSPNIGTGSITLRNDPRLLPMGKFLRKTKINELPQILNVLMGDMSLVGPRPLDERAYQAYPAQIRDQVYDSPPGITGIGSVVFRDEEALVSSAGGNPHDFYRETIAPYKGSLEIWYNRHRGFVTDLMLLLLTVWVVFFPGSRAVYSIFKDLPPNTINV